MVKYKQRIKSSLTKKLYSEVYHGCFQTVFIVTSKAMTQRISSEQEEKTGHAQALVRCYGDSVATNNKLMERAASSMEEPDMAAFVQVCVFLTSVESN